MAFVGALFGTSAGGTGAVTASVTYSPTAGNTLVIQVNLESTSTTLPLTSYLTSVTDNASGGSSTYVKPTGTFSAGLSSTNIGQASWMLYCQSVKSGVTTITANINTSALATDFASIVVGEYSSLGNFEIAGAMNFQNKPGTGANVITSTSGITSTNGDTIIGMSIDWGSSNSLAGGTSFTRNYLSSDGSYAIESLTQGSAASIAATFTSATGGSGAAFITGMMAFQPPASGASFSTAYHWNLGVSV